MAAREDLENVDIVIVGGGPVGLTTALELAHCNVQGRVVLVDANSTPCGGSLLPRGQYVNARTMELWDRWGLDVPEKVCACLAIPERITVHMNHFEESTGKVSTTLQEPSSHMSKMKGSRILQPRYEQVLRDALMEKVKENKNFQVLFGHTVASLERDNESWLVSVETSQKSIGHYAETKGGDGMNECPEIKAASGGKTFRAKYVVGCDGGRSFVRRSLGRRFEGKGSLGVSLTVLFKSKTLYPALRERFAELPDGVLYSFKTRDGAAAGVGLVEGTDTFYSGIFYKDAQEAPNEDILDDLTSCMALLAHRCPGLRADAWADAQPFESYLWTSYNLCCDKEDWIKDNVILAGDAAHLLSPAGGLGMNSGVADAINIAWKLALIINNKTQTHLPELEALLLKSYADERWESYRRASGFNEQAWKDVGNRNMSNYDYVIFGSAVDQPVLHERAPYDADLFEELAKPSKLSKSSAGFTLILAEPNPSIEQQFLDTMVKLNTCGNVIHRHDSVAKVGAIIIRPDFAVSFHGPTKELSTLMFANCCTETFRLLA